VWITVIPALERLRQEASEFKASLSYMARLSQKQEIKQQQRNVRKGHGTELLHLHVSPASSLTASLGPSLP
jgi:hypothetical protein